MRHEEIKALEKAADLLSTVVDIIQAVDSENSNRKLHWMYVDIDRLEDDLVAFIENAKKKK